MVESDVLDVESVSLLRRHFGDWMFVLEVSGEVLAACR